MNVSWLPFIDSTGELMIARALIALVLYDQATFGTLPVQPEYRLLNATMLAWVVVGAWPVTKTTKSLVQLAVVVVNVNLAGYTPAREVLAVPPCHVPSFAILLGLGTVNHEGDVLSGSARRICCIQ